MNEILLQQISWQLWGLGIVVVIYSCMLVVLLVSISDRLSALIEALKEQKDDTRAYQPHDNKTN